MSFWRKNNITPAPQSEAAVVAEDPEPAPVPTSKPVSGELAADEFAEYARIAAEIGMSDAPAVRNERVRQFLAEENIHVYSGEAVCNYLDEQLGKGKWGWAGLRQSDVDHLKGWVSHHGERLIPFGERQYAGAVPLPVLLTVQKISKAIPGAYFYVSDPNVADDGKDPFLLVTARGMNSYIVERWDEPSFREVKK